MRIYQMQKPIFFGLFLFFVYYFFSKGNNKIDVDGDENEEQKEKEQKKQSLNNDNPDEIFYRYQDRRDYNAFEKEFKDLEDTLNIFVGSDIFVYKGYSKSLTLHGFADISNTVSTTFAWGKFEPPGLTITPKGSKALVEGFQNVLSGDYEVYLRVKNGANEFGETSVTITVLDSKMPLTKEQIKKFGNPNLQKSVVVILPQRKIDIMISKSFSSCQSVDWIKSSGNPLLGTCTQNAASGTCSDLVQGTYNFYVTCTKHDKISSIAKVYLVVYPAKFHIYDHYHSYEKNKYLLPQYIKNEPVLPACTKDSHYNEPKPDVQLLLEHLKSRAIDNTVIIGFTGSSYLSLAANWVCSLEKLKLHNYIVVAFDEKAKNEMIKFQNNYGNMNDKVVFYDKKMLGKRNMKFIRGSSTANQAWKELMSVKTSVIASIINFGYNVFVMDADTVVMKNPFDFVKDRAEHCDIQWQADGKDKFTYEKLSWRPHLNAGVYYALSNERTKPLYKNWLKAYHCQKGRREQHALILALHNFYRGGWTVHDPKKDLKVTPKNVTRFCYLEPEYFPDGGYFVHHDAYKATFGETEKGHQVMFHTNNMQQDDAKKVTSMKQENAWYLSEDLSTCKEPKSN